MSVASSIASHDSDGDDDRSPPLSPEEQALKDVGPPPDGGLDAWLCVFSTSFVLFCIFGTVTSFGQLQSYYLTHQLKDYSKSQVAWIGSCQSTLTFLGSIFSGRHFDAHGARGLAIAGTIMATAALVSLAFCQEYYQFLLAHMLFGLSGSIVYSPATGISGHWFARKRATAVGIIVGGSGLGGVIYPIMMKELFERMSFRDTILIIAGFSFVIMLPACWWMRARLPPRQPPPLRSLADPWKEARYVFLVLGSGVFMLNIFSPYFNAPVLAAQNNLPSNLAPYSVAMLQAGSFFGRIVAGVLADLFGVWTVFGTMTFSSAAVVFAFWTGASGTGATIAGFVLYGITTGAWFTLVAASCAAISPVHEVGKRLGILWSCVGLPVLAGPVVCGVLVRADGGRFGTAGIFCGATLLLGAFLTPGPRLVQIVGSVFRKHDEEVAEKPSESV